MVPFLIGDAIKASVVVDSCEVCPAYFKRQLQSPLNLRIRIFRQARLCHSRENGNPDFVKSGRFLLSQE